MQNEIQRTVLSSKLFKHLSYEQLDAICSQAVVADFAAGQVIVSEGELGDLLYVILSGEVRVYTFNQHAEEITLARLTVGDHFGEQALLTSIPIRRNANVRALTNVKALTLTHAMFQSYLGVNKNLLHLMREHGKEQMTTKLLKQLQDQEANHKELFSLFNRIEHYSERQVFFRQGDKADFAYYLCNGLVQVRSYNEQWQLTFSTQINPGQFFGEKSIIENSCRAGIAVAKTDATVAVIDAKLLKTLYCTNVNLRVLLNSLIQVYQIPGQGFFTEYHGNLFNFPAIHINITKPDGEEMIASRVIDSDIFVVRYADCKVTAKETFYHSDNQQREIQLFDNHLVGAINIGKWEDLPGIYRLIYDKSIITTDILEEFQRTRAIHSLKDKVIVSGGYLCECMQVKYHQVQELIMKGATTLEAISAETGASTVCGSCKSMLIELLGGEAWTFVKLTAIRKHNKQIHSFQFQPLHKKILPYQAGQHIVIEANIDGQWIARSYTLTSINVDTPYYEITVKRENHGYFSQWLFSHAQLGAILRISDPQGTFIFNPDETRPTICLMAGVGMTPAIAFVRKLIASQQSNFLYVDYSVHNSNDAIFLHELSAWRKHRPNIIINLRITSEQGHLSSQEINLLTTNHPDANFYLCGPTAYLTTMRNFLLENNINENRIYIEKFISAGEPMQSIHQD